MTNFVCFLNKREYLLWWHFHKLCTYQLFPPTLPSWAIWDLVPLVCQRGWVMVTYDSTSPTYGCWGGGGGGGGVGVLSLPLCPVHRGMNSSNLSIPTSRDTQPREEVGWGKQLIIVLLMIYFLKGLNWTFANTNVVPSLWNFFILKLVIHYDFCNIIVIVRAALPTRGLRWTVYGWPLYSSHYFARISLQRRWDCSECLTGRK